MMSRKMTSRSRGWGSVVGVTLRLGSEQDRCLMTGNDTCIDIRSKTK